MKKLTRRADGRYVKCITDPRTKKRVYFYGKTEKEINKKILEYQTKEVKGRTFAEVAEEWYEVNNGGWSSNTQISYKIYMKEILKEFGKFCIKDIIPSDISKYFIRSAKNKESKSMVAVKKNVLSGIFKYAVIQNDLQFSPCAVVSLPKGLREGRRSAVSPEIEAVIKNTHELWIVPYIALMTGCRKGEIIALQWKDIDFENKIINITKSAITKGNSYIISSTKTKTSVRAIPLLKPLETVLNSIRVDNPNVYISTGTEKMLTQSSYDNLLKSYKKKTGIQFTLHQLRHSFATIAIENGVPPKTVQEILGHSDIATTLNIYTDVRKKSFDDAYLTLNNVMK